MEQPVRAIATSGVEDEVVDLVDRARAGDRQAFALLYDRYVTQIYGYVYRRVGHRETAEDLCADVFLRAWGAIGSFSWRGVDPGAWLVTIARNRVNDHFKSARYRMERTSDEVTPQHAPSTPDDPERVTVARDMARSLGAALELLKGDHREVIELRFVHGMSVADTASVMGRTTGAVKALQYRALKALAEVVSAEPSFSHLAGISVASLVVLLRMLVP